MNKIYFFFLLLFSPLTQNAQSIRVKGSDTMYPFVSVAAEIYDTSYNVKVYVKGGGSGKGLKDLNEGKVDLAIASRAIKASEIKSIESNGDKLIETIVAYDALSIIIHPENPIKKLTLDQLHDIFTGKFKNWSELGGNNAKIKVFTRKPESGTYAFMKKKVLKGTDYAEGSNHVHKNNDMVRGISNNKNAIGFCGLAYLKKGVKPVLISEDGTTYVKPNYLNTKNGIYPVARPLHFYYTDKKESLLKGFIDFLLSFDGQELVFQEGYVPIEEEALNNELDINIDALFDF
ncbi:MAG: PstS family phosphate ABC transporter substrate-binding protein [Cyclobacteriaceae bacterium]